MATLGYFGLGDGVGVCLPDLEYDLGMAAGQHLAKEVHLLSVHHLTILIPGMA